MRSVKMWLLLFSAVVLLVVLGGCVTSYFGYNDAERGMVVPDGKILVISKVGFDVDPAKLFNIPEGKESDPAWQNLIVSYGTDAEDPMAGGDEPRGFPVLWGDYKAVMIPKTDAISIKIMFYMPMAVYAGREAQNEYYIVYEKSLVAKLNSDDKVVYIGDIYHSFLRKNELGQNDTQVEIKDNFLKVNNLFNGFAVDKDGSPLPVAKRLITLDGYVGFSFDKIHTVRTVRGY